MCLNSGGLQKTGHFALAGRKLMLLSNQEQKGLFLKQKTINKKPQLPIVYLGIADAVIGLQLPLIGLKEKVIH